MKIQDLYRTLCSLYGIDDAVDIEHFLVLAVPSCHDVVLGDGRLGREALFIRQDGDDLELGLFIDPSIVVALDAGDPLACIDEVACAAEGASHFLYVIECAKRGRSISPLELELQGEVDKFLILQFLAADGSPHRTEELFARQFEHHAFDARLSAEERERYETASHFAAKYCHTLRKSCFAPLRLRELIPQARDFFRRDLRAKLARLIP